MKHKLISRNGYKYYRTGKDESNLCVLFPSATSSLKEDGEFVNILSKYFSVLYMKEGYYGVSKIENKNNLSKYKLGKLVDALANEVGRFKPKKLLVIGSSVGALHAYLLATKTNIKNTKIVFISPAFYKNQVFLDVVFRKILRIAQKSTGFMCSKKLSWPLTLIGAKKLSDYWKHADATVGQVSYLKCLEEIINFPKDHLSQDKNIINRSMVIVGNKDPFFHFLCDKGKCKKSANYVSLKAFHSPCAQRPKDCAKLTMDFVEK